MILQVSCALFRILFLGNINSFLFFQGHKFTMWTDGITRYDVYIVNCTCMIESSLVSPAVCYLYWSL